MYVCVCYRSRKKTLDWNDLKLGTVVLLNSPPKPIDFVPNRFRGKGGSGGGGNEIWDPLNISVSDEATLFKFGVHVDPGLFLPADLKLAPKWAWPGVRAQF